MQRTPRLRQSRFLSLLQLGKAVTTGDYRPSLVEMGCVKAFGTYHTGSLIVRTKTSMKLLMVYPGMVDYLPPLLTSASGLALAGIGVTVVAAGCSDATGAYLARFGVELITCGRHPVPRSKLGKAVFAATFLKLLHRLMIRLAPEVVWYHDAHGMRYGWFCDHTRPHISVGHAHELYSTGSFDDRIYRQPSSVRPILVIVPEINRAWMMRVRSGSMAMFAVIPNRLSSDALPASRGESATRSAFLQAGGHTDCRKFVIYQGAMNDDRCLNQALAAFQSLVRPDWGFIVLGVGDDAASKALLDLTYKDDRRIVFLHRIPPPGHLEITRGCDLGIVLYAPTSLNNIYCAPNKVFEYAYFGVGMILPDYPGLAALNTRFSFGEVCSPVDEVSVANALSRAMATPRDSYRHACERFLSAVPDPGESYGRIAETLRKWSLDSGTQATDRQNTTSAP